MIVRYVTFLVIFQFIELYLLVILATYTSIAFAIGLSILTGLVGGMLARMEGFQVLLRINQAMQEGRMPNKELLDGVFILIGGIVLLTPGIITDVLGFLCLIPATRQRMAALAAKKIGERIRANQGVIEVEYREF